MAEELERRTLATRSDSNLLASGFVILDLPGGIAVFGSILWILARAVQHYRKTQERFAAAIYLGCIGGIVAILVHSLADFNLYIPANALVFTVTLALAAGERRSAAAVFDADA